MKAEAEWLDHWRVNPRRWHETALLELPIGARVFERGVGVRRTSAGLSWWVYYGVPVAPGSKRKRTEQEHVDHCRNKTQAEGLLAQRRAEVFQGTYQPRTTTKEITLARLAEEAFNARATLKSVEKYRSHWKNHVEPWFKANRSPRSIERKDVQAFYAEKLKTCAVASANYYVATLRVVMQHALEHGYVTANPCARVKIKKPNNNRERMLSSEEAARLLVAARRRQDYIRPLYLLIHDTGMRLGEALRLVWSDYNAEAVAVRVRESKNDEGRWVHLAADTAAELARWRVESQAKERRRGHSPWPWVFPGRQKRDGTRGHIQEVKKAWASLCDDAGVKVGRHELRHSFISHALAAGHSAPDIMRGTGHKSMRAFEGYAHSNAERSRAVAESVAATRTAKLLREACADEKPPITPKSKRASG